MPGCSDVIRVRVLKEEPPDRGGFGRAEATAVVQRVAMMTADAGEPGAEVASPWLLQAVEDPTQEPLTLLNLLLAVGDAGLTDSGDAQVRASLPLLGLELGVRASLQ